MGTKRLGTVISIALLLALAVGCASKKPDVAAATEVAKPPVAETPAVSTKPVEPVVVPKAEEPAQIIKREGKIWVPDTLESGTAGAAGAAGTAGAAGAAGATRGTYGTGAGSSELAGKFYFDYDQAIVKREGHDELTKHAAYLVANRSESVRLEGHADERGTREYNLALGERRANAVSAYLRAQSVNASQIEVISYGEEKPLVLSHEESGWAQNRRVEIVYR